MSNRRLSLVAGVSLLAGMFLALVPRGSEAVQTRTFAIDSAADFSAGTLDRVSVTSEGAVVAGAELQRIALDPPALTAWSALDLGDGSALVGTGVDGRVYRVQNGNATLYAQTDAVLVTSLARAEDGTVYAATIPEGKIYRLRPPQGNRPQTPELVVQLPDTEHVWALAWDRSRRVLLAATGPQGKLFAVDNAGHATVVFDSDEPHLYTMTLGADGTAYVGAGGGHAVLFAVRAPGNVRALARFTGDEVKAVVLGENNELFVAANEFEAPPEPLRRTTSQTRLPTPGGTGGSRPRPGRGSVYRVRTDGVFERIYANTASHVTSLEFVRERNEVLAGLGVNGRVVGVSRDRSVRELFDLDENSVPFLLTSSRSRLLGTGDSGAVYSVGAGRPAGATWTSRVLDGTTVARWGVLRARATGTLTWESRSGNSDPPDNTWTPWTALGPDESIRSPGSRYLQVRARWGTANDAELRAVTVFYLPTNQRAVLTEVLAEAKTGTPRPLAFRIGWKVDNSDGDALRYRLRFRGENDRTWRSMLRVGEYLTTTSYDWSVDGLPEGFYRVQVEASDEADNAENDTETHTRTTEPVLVDITPPRVTVSSAGRRIRGEAQDGTSAVTRIEIAVDTQEYRSVRAADGVLDERQENFEVDLTITPDNGEHVVSVRAYDEAGNVGVATTTFRATR